MDNRRKRIKNSVFSFENEIVRSGPHLLHLARVTPNFHFSSFIYYHSCLIGLYRFVACRLWSELFSTWKTAILSRTSGDKVTCVRPISHQTLRSEDLADRRSVISEILLVDSAWLSIKSEMVFFKFACVVRQLTSLHSVLYCRITESFQWDGLRGHGGIVLILYLLLDLELWSVISC